MKSSEKLLAEKPTRFIFKGHIERMDMSEVGHLNFRMGMGVAPLSNILHKPLPSTHTQVST